VLLDLLVKCRPLPVLNLILAISLLTHHASLLHHYRSGLSAVDAAKALYAGGHTGSVVLASRRGLLPTIKAPVCDPFVPLSVATPEGTALHYSAPHFTV
jgi:hypothetical protein